MDLLTAPESRPVIFSLKDAGEKDMFDQRNVGLNTAAPDALRHGNLLQAWVYDVNKPGQSNRGHEFGIDLSAMQKLALIEYLKTL